MVLFKRITIVGLGLIGGSIGMVVRRRHLARSVVGLSRRQSTLRIAKKLGVIDIGTTDARNALHESDLVIIATPVDTIISQAPRLAKWMKAGSILMDVGSTKALIVKTLERRLPTHVAFVGAHPLTGSERRGISSACVNLFDGSLCILTKTRRTDTEALRMVRRFWLDIADRVMVMDPKRHDQLLAFASHLPHFLAFCLMGISPNEVLSIAPRSFRDATRVAKSDPKLWEDIFFSNSKELLAAVDKFDHRLRLMRSFLSKSNRIALTHLLDRAKAKRDKISHA